MKIQKLQINGFGNLQNKNLELQDHINIIYGKNESGKSTLLKCITNIFYGTSKNKKGRDISDYDKFLPWKGEDFSAKLSYKLDDGRKYEVYREFGKRNPKIYDEEAKDISALFTQDKTKGNQFFYEQTGVEEETFLSSLAVMQKEVKLEEGQQNTIIQKVANLVSTGNEGVSFKRCINQLNKRQLEEVGTARSQDRPINILEEELENLEIEKSSLELIKKEKYEIEDKKKALEKIIDGQRNKVDILDKLKQSKEQEKIEQEKIQMNLEIIKRNDEQIEKLQKEKEDLERKQKIEEKGNKKRKNSNKKYLVISILLLILSIVALVIIPNLVIKQVMGAFGVASSLIFLIIFFIKKQKCVKAERKRKKEETENLGFIQKIQGQQEALEKANKEQQENISKMESILQEKRNTYQKTLEKETNINIEELLKLDSVEKMYTNSYREYNEKQVELRKIELEEKEILSQLEELACVQERIEKAKEEQKELEQKGKSINLAKEVMEEAYKQMQESVTPRFTEELSKAINNISNGKYKKVKLNSQDGLMVELENGNYGSVNLLSTGTIDQLYLSLRLAMIKELTKESLPIILDESFAYYDEERLENILKYLSKEVTNQIIILTCTNRERKLLDKDNISYNYMEI